MKYLILITTISIMACTQTQVADRAEDSENFERNHLDKMITLIKLYSFTRGSEHTILIDKNEFITNQKSPNYYIKKFEMNDEKYKELLSLVDSDIFSKLDKIEVQNTGFASDAGHSAILTLYSESDSVSSPVFTLQQPPDKIKLLINQIHKMSNQQK